CAKPAVLMTSTHELGMANESRLTVLGSPQPSRDKDTLCRGDLSKIMTSASLDPDQQQKLHSFICGGKDSVSALNHFYYGLPDNQRLKLRQAFEHYGYDIQNFGCSCGF
ncbi:MAG: hypothetical protein ACP5SG_00830, partial [Dissulfurimicrobium sp.]